LQVDLFDHDTLGGHDSIGSVTLPLDEISRKQVVGLEEAGPSDGLGCGDQPPAAAASQDGWTLHQLPVQVPPAQVMWEVSIKILLTLWV
jgi:hypothetical protein